MLHNFLFAALTCIKVDRSLAYERGHCNNCLKIIIIFALSTHEVLITQQLFLNCLQSFKFKTVDINPHSFSSSSQIFNIFITWFVPIFQLLVPFLAFWLNFNISIIAETDRLPTLIFSNPSSFDCNYISFMNIKFNSLTAPDCSLYLNTAVINQMKISSISLFTILPWNEFSWWLDLANNPDEI